jgi:hypothetical protein
MVIAFLPKIGQNVPKIGQNVPKIGQNVPKIGQNVPKIGQNLPKIDQNFEQCNALGVLSLHDRYCMWPQDQKNMHRG